eukprot:Pgem_evm2s15057
MVILIKRNGMLNHYFILFIFDTKKKTYCNRVKGRKTHIWFHIYTGTTGQFTFISYALKTSSNVTNIYHDLKISNTINGHVLAENDIIYLRQQTTANQNGLWKVVATPSYANQEEIFSTDFVTVSNIAALYSDIRVGKVLNSQTIIDGDKIVLLGNTINSERGVWLSENSGITQIHNFTNYALTTSVNIEQLFNPLSAGQEIDGHVLLDNEKVFLANQTTTSLNNGIWTVNADTPVITENIVPLVYSTGNVGVVIPDIRIGNTVDSHVLVGGDTLLMTGQSSSDNGLYTLHSDINLTTDHTFTVSKIVDNQNVDNLYGSIDVNDVVESITLLSEMYIILNGQTDNTQNGVYKIRSSFPEFISNTIHLTTTQNVDIDKINAGEIFQSKTLQEFDRVLLVGQTNSAQNGI